MYISEKQEITWKFINNVYVAAITVCQARLDSSLRQVIPSVSVIVLGAMDTEYIQDEKI